MIAEYPSHVSYHKDFSVMHSTSKVLLILSVAIYCISFQAGAQTMPDQQSTTGPIPPPSVLDKGEMKMIPPEQGGASQIIDGVPAYSWRHGCGPTALGMVVGFYDGRGFPDLFDGDASIQTWEVLTGIASQGDGVRGEGEQQHYEDYALPKDDEAPAAIPDSSETYPDGCHVSNSIADFMHTSWSADGNLYGWSWSSMTISAFTSYVSLRNPDYIASAKQYWMINNTLTWDLVKQEIDNNRPMAFLVDTDGDGGTDHFVTVIGYSDGPPQQYGCLDTWFPFGAVRWCDFAIMASGVDWGIHSGWTFSMENPEEGEGEPCVENPEQCPNPQGGQYVEGNDLCLCVPCPVSEISTYSWSKDGMPLTNGGRVFGADERTLQIILLETGDSGLYSCTYDDGFKAEQVFEAQVAVVERVPAISMLGIISLVAIVGAVGMRSVKRRR